MVRTVSAWRIWSLPRYVIAVLFGVELLAVLLPWTDSAAVTSAKLRVALLLTLLSITYSVATVTFERVRVLLAKGTSPGMCPDLISTWSFAAAVMLPTRLAALVVVIGLAADWPARNVARQAEVYRYVYSGAVALLAVTAAGAIQRSMPPSGAGLLLAGLGFIAVGAAGVALAMLSVREPSQLRMFLRPRTYAIEACTVSLGIGEVLIYDLGLPLVWLSLPAAVVIQQWSSRAALKAAIALPEPLAEQVWLHIARTIVAGCPMSAVLRVDSDDPAVLRALTTLVKSGLDAVGRYRGGLAVLLVDCPDQHADALAMRLRSALRTDGGHTRVAVAAAPRDGRTVESLLVLTEAELAISGHTASRV